MSTFAYTQISIFEKAILTSPVRSVPPHQPSSVLQCKSWFKSNSETSRIVDIWPDSPLHACRAIGNLRLVDL